MDWAIGGVVVGLLLVVAARAASGAPPTPQPPRPDCYDRKVAARRGDWKTVPTSPLRKLPFKRTFSPQERAFLAWGTVPRETDDKWFIFQEGPTLYCYRSWTGQLVYQVSFRGASVSRAQVCADPAVFRSQGDEEDAASLGRLLDNLVKGAFP